MQTNNSPIGVLDSGIGGLTVVRELQQLLPGEDIVYFGDSANCPYGNRSREEILALSRRMLRFLGSRSVKAVAIACNTISALADVLSQEFDFPIIGIIAPTAALVAREGLSDVGLFATEFTIASGGYERLIHALDPSVEVVGKGSPLLAELVDSGKFDKDAIDAEITRQIGNILSRAPVRHIILGCTHYPIVIDSFRRLYPGVEFINPAVEQARAVGSHLAENGGLSSKEKGTVSLFTSGSPEVFADTASRLGIRKPAVIEQISLSEESPLTLSGVPVA